MTDIETRHGAPPVTDRAVARCAQQIVP